MRVIFLLAIICGVWWITSVRPGSVVIQAGDSVQSVADDLRAAGIIKSTVVLKISYRLFRASEHVYPGVIVVDSSCSLRCIAQKITSPDRSVVRVMFTEGQDIRDLAKLLESKKLGSGSELYAIVGVPAAAPTQRTDLTKDFSFLEGIPKNISYEGYLFPDTYDFPHDASVEQIVRVMLRNFDRRVTPEMRAAAVAQGRSLHEVVTMASILEREVRKPVEQRMVADILWRRIDRGMGLQVDSSVNYATETDNLYTTKRDRSAASLWNTYKYKDLPVGPIGNPGLASLQAALDPEANNFWYYLTSPDGTVHYARTFEEHISNKRFLK